MGCGGSKDTQPASSSKSRSGGGGTTTAADPMSGITLPPKSESKDFNSSASMFSKTPAAMPQLAQKLDETAAATFQSKGGNAAIRGPHHLKNIFAAPLGDLGNFTAPAFAKEPREQKFIRKALERNFVFS